MAQSSRQCAGIHFKIRSIRLADGKVLCTGTDVEIQGGQIVVLRAPVGWGKTLLMRVLGGWSDHVPGLIVDGEIDLNGRGYRLPADLADLQHAARESVGCMFHKLSEESFGITLGEEIDQLRLRWCRGWGEVPAQVSGFLQQLERGNRDLPMDMLAKGLRQILAVIDVLADLRSRPLILLDEPSSYLGDEWLPLLHALLELALQFNPCCAILISSHDDRLARPNYRLLKCAAAQAENPAPNADMAALYSAIEQSSSMCTAVGVRIRGQPVANGVPLPFQYDVNVEAGESAVITGPNSSGKSSLLLSISGLYKVRGECAVIDRIGRVIPRRRRLHGHLGLVFQEPHDYEFRPSVAELVSPERKFNSSSSSSWRQFVESMYRAYDIFPQQDPRTLSSGQLRIAWLMSQIGWSKTWLTDEIEAAWDQATVAVFKEIAAVHFCFGGSVLAVTHQPEVFENLVQKRIQLNA